MKAVGMSDIGRCRKNNEDAYYISAGSDPAENIYLVADGMGGCNAGEIASSSAIEAFLEHFWKEMQHAEKEDFCLQRDCLCAMIFSNYENRG